MDYITGNNYGHLDTHCSHQVKHVTNNGEHILVLFFKNLGHNQRHPQNVKVHTREN